MTPPPATWRAQLLRQFVRGLRQTAVVFDPDDLLSDAAIESKLTERGFTIVPEEGAAARADAPDRLFVTTNHAQHHDIDASLASLFPHLSYRVLRWLDRGVLDALYDPHAPHARRAPAGDTTTFNLVLRQCFNTRLPIAKGDPLPFLRAIHSIGPLHANLAEFIPDPSLRAQASDAVAFIRKHHHHLRRGDLSDVHYLAIMHQVQTSLPDIPAPTAHHAEWCAFADAWGEAVQLAAMFAPNAIPSSKIVAIDNAFAAWLQDNYHTLHSLPSIIAPVMVHHIAPHIAAHIGGRVRAGKSQKVALIVADGMAMAQWKTIRPWLSLDANIVESAAFAWIPSTTSVSRQAIFAGKVPRAFAKTINTTNKEEQHWRAFWQANGIDKAAVYYQRSLGSDDIESWLPNIAHKRVLGLVVDSIDKIMHGMELASTGMHSQTEIWAQQGYLGQLLNRLLAQDFAIWITADHGNVECTGAGKNASDAKPDSGERTKIYRNARDRDNDVGKDTMAWSNSALPDDYHPLLAGNNGEKIIAFACKGDTMIAHGGASLEEVIVPLIAITRD